jgi:hypothetical protein
MNYEVEYIEFFKKIIDESKSSSLYSESMEYIQEQFNNYSISDKEKAELTINFVTNITNSIITSAMQVALSGVNSKLKIEKELISIDKANENAQAQSEVHQANKALLEEQKLLVTAEKEYKVKQAELITITNSDNKVIKALDSTSDMIGTIGAGGLQIPQKLVENYFSIINQLLGTNYDGQINITQKAT